MTKHSAPVVLHPGGVGPRTGKQLHFVVGKDHIGLARYRYGEICEKIRRGARRGGRGEGEGEGEGEKGRRRGGIERRIRERERGGRGEGGGREGGGRGEERGGEGRRGEERGKGSHFPREVLVVRLKWVELLLFQWKLLHVYLAQSRHGQVLLLRSPLLQNLLHQFGRPVLHQLSYHLTMVH